MTNTESNMATPVKYHLGKFPPTNIDWKQLVPLLGQANISLGRYDELLKGIPRFFYITEKSCVARIST